MPSKVHHGGVKARTKTSKQKSGKNTFIADYYTRKDGAYTAQSGKHKGKRVAVRSHGRDKKIKAKTKAKPGYGHRGDYHRGRKK